MPSTSPAWNEFEAAVREWRSLESIDALAGWDQETMLPPQAAAARSSHRAALRGVLHERLTGPQLGELLERAAALPDLDDRQQALVRVVRRDRERETKLPARLVIELTEAQGRAVQAWKEARRAKRFDLFQPHVEHLIALRREEADARGHDGERYDALLEGYEPGMTVARLQPIFARLRDGLMPIVDAVAERPAPRLDFLSRDAFDPRAQLAFSHELLRGMGFDLNAGRLDESVHPFCSSTAPTDVRLTTRLARDDAANGLFSVLHEGGHGLYEQGLPQDGTALSSGASMGLHESQSRLWENLIGRSLPFWTHWYPRLQRAYGTALDDISLDEWLRAINHVRRTLIRVDADEVTYNLHILVRFEVELDIVRGHLEAADLPEAWNERYERIVGVRPPDDGVGVLQDIHWAWGEFGYFPTYSVGNMYAASLLKAAERALPTLWSDVERGDTSALLSWLRTHVHRFGRTRDAEDIVRDATGEGLTERDLLDHLRAKYAV